MATLHSPDALPIEAESREEVCVFPASFAEERLVFLDRLEPASALYNISVSYIVEGDLDHDALVASVNEIVRRHDILRSTFATSQGRSLQVVGTASAVPIPVVDLSGVPEPERLEEAQRLALEETLKPFDLEHGPLLRVRLFRMGDPSHLLLLTIHHIVFDAWSVDVFMRELGALYAAFHAGSSSRLPELPIQYGDFAEWQRQWLTGEVLEKQLSYWNRRLAGAPGLLELPTDRPRPPVQSSRGERHEVTLSKQLSRELRALSQREGATLFMTLLASFQTLLGRLTEKEDILVGTPIAGRNRRETEELIGLFVNTLVLRGDLSGDPTFRQLLGRVRDTALEAHAHQDLPFEKLVEELRPVRNLGHTPLFQVMFGLASASREAPQIPGLTLRRVQLHRPLTHFDLSLDIVDRGEELICAFWFNTDLFDSSTILRLAGHFRTLLEGIVADPDQHIWELPLLTEIERRQLLVDSNGTEAPLPRQATVHQLFEEQAARSPEAVAAVRGTERLTYRELDTSANRLAHYLLRLGVGPDVRVGICIERSLEMLVGLLGTMKAGGAYVPIDPTYPRERIEFLLQDSGAAVVLTAEKLAEILPVGNRRVVRLDADQDVIGLESGKALPPVTDPKDLAYIIYTSGSTGRPKGVEILQRGLLNYVTAVSRLYEVTTSDRVLQFASLSFDAATEEIFIPLARGATVVLRSDEMLRSVPAFLEACRDSGVTVLILPTAYWHELVVEMAAQGLRFPNSVRLVVPGGEKALPERLAQWRELAGDRVRLWNGYGPTEATIAATFCDLTEWLARTPSPATVPIGNPIANVKTYVLDRRGELRPPGLSGELYIGGAGLARGYRNLAEETDRRFVPSPLPENRGERLYRTGDIVRWRIDGQLEFLERVDDQVKIRGFRIELGEIESVLAQDPSIAESAVIAREDSAGDKRLVAYVVGVGRIAPPIPRLRALLKSRLPDYMLPSAFVALDRLPLTPTGKLDRLALPEPGEAALRDTAFVAPGSPVEEVLAAIWAQVLKVQTVGTADDFFSLGGHSLIATRVISRVRGALGVELPLRALFQAPTVAGLAEIIAAGREPLGPPPPALIAEQRPANPVLSFAQQRLWFLEQLSPGNASYNSPFVLRLTGELDAGALQRAFDAVLERHESLRTRFESVDGNPVQRIEAAVTFSLVSVDLSGLSASEREAAAMTRAAAEVAVPFDLSRAPLLRGTVLRLGPSEHLLVVTMHHIVCDGWSAGIFVNEMAAFYEQARGGRAAALAPLAVQYADFARWQREWLTGEVLERQLGYWRKQLAELPVLALPTDRPRPAVQSFRGARRSTTLSTRLAEGLKELSRREGATLYMTLLAAFQVLLSRYSGQHDVAVGSPIAGRNRTETEPLIGFFINTLVLRGDLSGDPPFRELLRRVRDAAFRAYEHQDLPFEKLVEELQPQRDLRSNPLVQVLFALQNAPAGALELEGLEVAYQPIEIKTTRFDLEVYLGDTPAGLACTFVYASDLFDPETIARMMSHWETLLQSVVREPDRAIAALPLLAADERDRLLEGWNQTESPFPGGSTVAGLIEQQAGKTPAADAAVFGRQRLTYRELDEQASRLGRYLRKRGVGPDVLVGLCVERSLDMVVGILGIWKAGGAYVPLDPAYPAERVAFMLDDSRVSVVVTQESLARSIPGDHRERVLLDTDRAAIEGESPAPLESGAGPRNLAYVIYTSGSTGVPKGVAIEHRSAVALLDWARQFFCHGELEGVLASTSVCFDLSVFELFAPLVSGGKVILSRDVLALAELPAVSEVTLVNTVPSAVAELLRMGALPVSAATVLLAGEPLPTALVNQIAAAGGGPRRVFDLYGPTEDTTYSTCARREPRAAPTIGRPVANKRAYILDRRLEPVPPGVEGDLYVAGAGVSRGYLNRPEMTGTQFLPDLLQPGGRMYRTGDRARFLPDGNIQFLGRRDQQVKVRGHRIEIGEIEGTLLAHPDVFECAVAVRDDPAGARRLVAYVVSAGHGTPSAGDLRGFLKTSLPDPMVPSVFLFLDALPLTPNGKVDRRALPTPETTRPQHEGPLVAPRTPTEKTIAAIWTEVLGLNTIDIHDNFFDLGGHSLVATRVFARLQAALPTQLSLRALFEKPTVAELAEEVERAGGLGAPLRPAIAPVSRRAQQAAAGAGLPARGTPAR